jgi:hypothetical protein
VVIEHQDGRPMLVAIDMALALHRGVDRIVEVLARWFSGTTTRVTCGSFTYSLSMAVRRRSCEPIS